MNEKIVVNRFVPKFLPRNLPWTKREGLLIWYEQTKCEQFLKDTDNHFEKLQITNFDIINANGQVSKEKLKQYQAVDHLEITKYPLELREQIMSSIFRLSKRACMFVEKETVVEQQLRMLVENVSSKK